MKKGLFTIGFGLMLISYCAGQAFTVIKATRQSWAGGVAGRTGISYVIELEPQSHGIVPDTVWINGYVYPIDSFTVKGGRYTKSLDSTTHKIKYTILATEMHEDYFRRHPPGQKDTTAKKPGHIRSFEGAALISYRHKKKQRFYTVKSFTELKQLNYP